MLTLLGLIGNVGFFQNICINLYFANVCQLSEIKVRYLKSNLFWTITLHNYSTQYVGKWIQVSSLQFQKFIVKRLHVSIPSFARGAMLGRKIYAFNEHTMARMIFERVL